MKPAPEGDLKAWLDKLLPHNPTMVSTLAGLSGVGVLPVRFIPCVPPPGNKQALARRTCWL